MENWKDIPGYEGSYAVSDLGRVKSVYAKGFRKPGPHHGGYLLMNLYRDGKRKSVTLHRLVWETFNGVGKSGLHICHLDGNPKNNRLSNLAQVDAKTNHTHKKIHGTYKFGESHPISKLSEKNVLKIRAAKGRVKQKVLAKKYGVTYSNISAIQLRKSWRHV